MNVLVQEYIFWDYSGLYFSNLDNQKILSVIKWWNSLLVDWKVNWTNLYMDENYNIIKDEYYNIIKDEYFIQEKILDKDFKIKEYYKKVYIEKKFFLELLKTFIKIEKIYDYPVDIEWTIMWKKVYILQVRPITT